MIDWAQNTNELTYNLLIVIVIIILLKYVLLLTGSDAWMLIVGVSTGVPLAAIIAGLIACCVYGYRRRNSKETSLETRR